MTSRRNSDSCGTGAPITSRQVSRTICWHWTICSHSRLSSGVFRFERSGMVRLIRLRSAAALPVTHPDVSFGLLGLGNQTSVPTSLMNRVSCARSLIFNGSLHLIPSTGDTHLRGMRAGTQRGRVRKKASSRESERREGGREGAAGSTRQAVNDCPFSDCPG